MTRLLARRLDLLQQPLGQRLSAPIRAARSRARQTRGAGGSHRQIPGRLEATEAALGHLLRLSGTGLGPGIGWVETSRKTTGLAGHLKKGTTLMEDKMPQNP